MLSRAGFAVFAVAAFAAGLVLAGPATWQIWAFLVAPDLTFLVAFGRGLERGQLHPRSVPLYNTMHRLWLPVALGVLLAGVMLAGLVPRAAGEGWLAGACAWAAHIGVDRVFGFGLRDRRGFVRAG